MFRVWMMLFFLLLEISFLGVGVLRMWLDKEHAARWIWAAIASFAALQVLYVAG